LDRATTALGSSSSLRLLVILFDRDGRFGSDVFEFLKTSGIRPIAQCAKPLASYWAVRAGDANECLKSIVEEVERFRGSNYF
jgi:hypothetical protein